MRQIVSPIKIVRKILGQQKTDAGTPYRLSAHCVRVEQPEGVLLYQTMTGEMLLLSREEAERLDALPGPVPEELAALAAGWFLRPVGADDRALADQTRQIAARFAKKETALTGYTIFTTTGCNARCFYCFEEGWKPVSMTERTARDTADYIAARCGGKPVRLKWFGGEPLVNARAIDIITDELRRRGVEFHSRMISNGYLFGESLVQRARDRWRVRLVQITLDGTEEVYNRRKAYVNAQGSPYRQVLRNIGLLLDAGISVRVRLNMDGDNERDLYALVDALAERFAGRQGFGVYVLLLQENTGKRPVIYTQEERHQYAQKLGALRVYIEEKGMADHELLRSGCIFNACSADNDACTAVTPEGRLARCEGCMDDSVWGSIYSDEADEEVIRRWKERRPPEEACRTCAAYPQCIRLKRCPGVLEHCTPIERARSENDLRRAVLGSYEAWKAGGTPGTDAL